MPWWYVGILVEWLFRASPSQMSSAVGRASVESFRRLLLELLPS